MNLKSLRVFVLIMEHGTLVRASEIMHLSPPAVSRLLRLLEDELRQPLFERVKKRLIPTQAGEQLLPEALRILAGIDSLSDFLERSRQEQTPPLRLISHPRMASGLMLPAIKRLSCEFPDARVRLEVQPRQSFGSYIAQDQFHLGLGSLSAHWEDLESQQLCETRLCVLLPRDHPLAQRPKLNLRDLQDLDYIALTENTLLRQLIEANLVSSDLRLSVRHEVSVSAAAHQLVADGLGYTITEAIAVGANLPNTLKLVPLEPASHLKVGLFLSKSKLQHPLVDPFVKHLRQIVGELLEPHS
ncbi:HTH-type transcriptional regulator CynR [Falsiruegeria litorea R37]|uniref:HTH-type transcriptional regulator CynR n=1 Tax=Falsiruegeria litorea R37 TaxID=1200284 RepID=A0A1Y5T6D3_9RHOB|nr:LysR family transcriptional regulator [Falsiruegeria litorea]SLN56926.1 HTH-type transcriptional regulator CynR [Falsiruegeria litorea R37]